MIEYVLILLLMAIFLLIFVFNANKENKKDKVKKQGIVMFNLEWTPTLNEVGKFPHLPKHALIAIIIIEPPQKNVQNVEIKTPMIQYIVRNVEQN